MINGLSISVPVELIMPQIQAAIQASIDECMKNQPQPDPQYTAEQVAHLLNVDVQTVHDYTRLEAGHPRRLPYVVTHDSFKGKRFLLSDITAWQRRNQIDALQQVIPLVPKRPARRRATRKAA
ncbi:helix-turn-helix domain-containing protein [Hymenobacter sp. BT175]|uniref:helix-turn-helix domain-containing protein n=1 Tax=Hymenobacter translucens TaxID=2886507 RepID=UPI001D0E052A|nr:helix-turn-helix domain-containing protein [Hymenobacter translucens]MCC2547426.1 helix-turn-helix domain-containing protein [Hymenobacter translucens]